MRWAGRSLEGARKLSPMRCRRIWFVWEGKSFPPLASKTSSWFGSTMSCSATLRRGSCCICHKESCRPGIASAWKSSATAQAFSKWITRLRRQFRGSQPNACAPLPCMWAEAWRRLSHQKLPWQAVRLRSGHLLCWRSRRYSILRAHLPASTLRGPIVTFRMVRRATCCRELKRRSSASLPDFAIACWRAVVPLRRICNRWMQTWWAAISVEVHPIFGNFFFAQRGVNMRRQTLEFIFARLPRRREVVCMACAVTTPQSLRCDVLGIIDAAWARGFGRRSETWPLALRTLKATESESSPAVLDGALLS